MNKDFEILIENLFENFTDYGKVPLTNNEFLNKFEPQEYKLILFKLLKGYNILGEEDE
jgi:hypothetical protein